MDWLLFQLAQAALKVAMKIVASNLAWLITHFISLSWHMKCYLIHTVFHHHFMLLTPTNKPMKIFIANSEVFCLAMNTYVHTYLQPQWKACRVWMEWQDLAALGGTASDILSQYSHLTTRESPSLYSHLKGKVNTVPHTHYFGGGGASPPWA